MIISSGFFYFFTMTTTERQEYNRSEKLRDIEGDFSDLPENLSPVKLQKYFPILDRVYPELWDLQFDTNGDLALLIHYPVVTIVNSRDESHTIEDLYVQIPILTNPDLHILPTIAGGRSTFTPMEFQNGYRHSHLHRGNIEMSEDIRFTPFCTSTGPITEVICTFNEDPTLEKFEFILHTLDVFVAWESVEGIPYTYLKDANNKSSEGIFRMPTRKVFMHYLKPSNLECEYVFTEGKFQCQFSDLNKEMLVKIIPPSAGVTGTIIDGKFKTMDLTQIEHEPQIWSAGVYFRGAEITMHIKSLYKNSRENLDLDSYSIDPAFIYDLEALLTTIFNEQIKTNERIKREVRLSN